MYFCLKLFCICAAVVLKLFSSCTLFLFCRCVCSSSEVLKYSFCTCSVYLYCTIVTLLCSSSAVVLYFCCSNFLVALQLFCSFNVVFLLLYWSCSYLVVLVHTEAAHSGLDVFADMFRGRQETTFRLKPQEQNQLTYKRTARLVIPWILQFCVNHTQCFQICGCFSGGNIILDGFY